MSSLLCIATNVVHQMLKNYFVYYKNTWSACLSAACGAVRGGTFIFVQTKMTKLFSQ